MTVNNRYKKNITAVVLGLGINGLGIVRSLGINGIDVLGVYDSEHELGRYSRYLKAIRFPQLKKNESKFIRKLIDEVGDLKEKPILIAENDLYVMFISQHRRLLQKYFRFNLPEKDTLELLTSKNLSADYVNEKGLHPPKTYTINEKENIEQVLEGIDYPCVMKPVNSFSVNFDKKVLIFSDKKSLNDFFQEHPDLIDSVIIQQIIPGGDSNTFQATTYVSKDGTIAPIFTMRKIRQYLPDFGTTSYGISEDVPFIKEKVHDFLASINYRGFVSIEFKQHPDSGEWFYIETNPRLPYYHSLIYDAGINLPYLFYQDMLGLNPLGKSHCYQKNGIRWINFKNDLASFIHVFSKRKIGIMYWLMSLMKVRSFAYFNLNDLSPFLHACIDFIKFLFRKTVEYLSRWLPTGSPKSNTNDI